MKKATRQQRRAVLKGKARRPTVFPAHLGTTPQAWRAVKRQEWLEVIQALDRFMYGSAYVPARGALYTLSKEAERITKAMEQANWVAW